MNSESERRKAADHLYKGIMENRKAQWWKEDQYASRYPPGESEQALENLFSVFDESWLGFTLEAWVEKGGRGHPLINELVPQGLWPLVILVELGKDLEELRHLSRFKELVEELRNPSKFMAAWLESEIAAHCLRSEFSIELYPKVRGKTPDLKISLDSEEVLVEIKELGPGEMEARYYEVFDLLSSMVISNIPQGTSIELTVNRLPSNPEIAILTNNIARHLQQGAKRQVVSFRVGRVDVLMRVREDTSTSFSLIPPEEIGLTQLKRLGRSIKHEAKQIPLPYFGLVVLDAGVLQGFPNEVITDVVAKTFKKYLLPNVVAVAVVRSYKFYRRETEKEVIVVPNPLHADGELLKKLSRIFVFSRTRQLVPQ